MNKTIRIEVTWTSLKVSRHTHTRVPCTTRVCILLMRVPPQTPCIINTFSARDHVHTTSYVHSVNPIEARGDGGLLVPLSRHEIFAYCMDCG